ncbi:toxin-antitoxin system HicB family antitoxin [Prauserella endophytica]|uniref:Toxin-antitoxin system HicB family antitoxin n=1 Tax=Prauserella endophytica TaxID=1592324 RepID=A0ABY2RVT9_9PSEU|nr:toxin-antitoxin system HicB family antitoxin [Prauserella endophytica]PXY33107.1 HicB family protein [Prauserella coralliicola]TKG62605.1 toxin-antitoxin system HicB family antitoxin [Prauserella endophytica]
MDLTPYLDRLREDLSTAASAGDEQTQRAAAVLAAALEPAARLTLMNALADLAAEVTANLPDQVVEVRLDGRDVRVVVTGTAPESPRGPGTPPPPPAPPTPPSADTGDISRMTLRLFEQIKSQAEQAAAAQGVSLNTFVSQAVQGALQGTHQHQQWTGPKHRGGGSRSHLHGWVEG